MDVMLKCQEAGGCYKNGDLQGALAIVKDTWDEIPSPKVETPNSYLLVEYAVAICLKGNDLDLALRWAKEAPQFSEKRHQLGEAEFLLGKVHFARGELGECKALFLEAKKKSHGKIFNGENPEYLKLLKESC